MRLRRVLAAVAAAGMVAWSWQAARRGDHPLDDLGEAMRASHGPRIDLALAVATDVGSVFGLAGTSGSLALGVGMPVALDAAGAVTHHRSTLAPRDIPQHAAYAAMRKAHGLDRAEWLMVLDADEFLDVTTGAGRVQDLTDAAGADARADPRSSRRCGG